MIGALPGVALAQDCPAAPDHTAAFDRLFSQVQAAPDEATSRVVVGQMWALWKDAPDAQAQEVLDRGMRRRSSYDFLGALQDFETLIAYCPDYAEGYNQRALIRFIHRDYAAALADLDRVISLRPRHLGALSGRALTLMGLERLDEARETLLAALALNPWLPERRFLEQLQPQADDEEL